MLDKSRKLVAERYNAPKTGMLDKLASAHGSGNTLDAEFRLATSWKEARTALMAGAPVVAGFDHVIDRKQLSARVFDRLRRAGYRHVYLPHSGQIGRLDGVDQKSGKLIVRLGGTRVRVAPRRAHPMIRNAHYVTMARVPGTRRVMIHDPYGGTVREVDISKLDRRAPIKLSAWPQDSALRSSKLGFFRSRSSKKPLPIKPRRSTP